MKLFISHNSKAQIKIDALSKVIVDTNAVLNKFFEAQKKIGLYFNLDQPSTSPLAQPITSPLSENFLKYFNTTKDDWVFQAVKLEPIDPLAFWYVDHEGIQQKISEFYEAIRKSKHAELRKLAKEIKVQSIEEYDPGVVYAIEKLREFELYNKSKLYIVSRYLNFFAIRLAGGLCRDIRSGYRNIVHFFFKNMDDNSGADTDTLFKTINVTKQLLVNQQMNYNEYRRNNRVFRAIAS